MKNRTVRRLQTALMTVFAISVLQGPVKAEWGSIRANNRERGRENEGGRRVEPARAREREVRREHRREEVIRDRPHWDWDAARHEGYYWSGYHPGVVLGTLPSGYETFTIGGQPYYYYQGVYYQPGGSGYVVVNPPAGGVVPALPPGAQAVSANGAIYYYVGGAFYIQQPTGFQVVPPPLGVTVPTLPPGAAPTMINGVTYYTAGNVYYLPVMQNGMTVYTVVQP